jgi:hypothetical protein
MLWKVEARTSTAASQTARSFDAPGFADILLTPSGLDCVDHGSMAQKTRLSGAF